MIKHRFDRFFLFCFLSLWGICLFSIQCAHAAPTLKQEIVETLIPKLNSDRIIYFFGNYGCDSISFDTSAFKGCRISNLYSVHRGQKFMRTLAIVQFQEPIHQNFQEIHQEILQGESIGIALRKNGWQIDKAPLYFGSISLSSEVQSWMREKKTDQAALHIYKLIAFKKDATEPINYCTIIEIHSPQYLNGEWLEALYPKQYRNFQGQSPEIQHLLKNLNVFMKEFPFFEPNKATHFL